MDKTAIKNFAIEARKILMNSAIEQAGLYGISKDNIGKCLQKGHDFEVYETISGFEKRIYGSEIKKRENLVNAIKKYGFEQVIEETAYTWFNRIIAIRFMEVNDYLPSRVRVLSSETGSLTPDIINQYYSIDLNLSSDELDIIQKKKEENDYDEVFRLLFVKQCNELNGILPRLFEKIDDYMELLLKLPYTSDGVIRLLIDSIPESNFNVEKEGQVEIIGWLYQYYNSELKDDTFAKLKNNIKITKERVPAATQLFTPDWIVRYMVENSVGRVWIDHLCAIDNSLDENNEAKQYGWDYYLGKAKQGEDVSKCLINYQDKSKDIIPQGITCIDPCMGSGHILVYVFDVLMDIYKGEGYSERDAVFEILNNNIYGLDIDRRAYQLSYFALMMKGRGYCGRSFFHGKENERGERVLASPHVYVVEESNLINRDILNYYGGNIEENEQKMAVRQMNSILDSLSDAREYGSLINMDNYDWDLLRRFLDSSKDDGQMTIERVEAYRFKDLLCRLVDISEILSRKYVSVVTNPPYMGGIGMSPKLSDYTKKYYADSKSDLFAVFIERCIQFAKTDGYISMITQHAWMFLSSYEKLRNKIYQGTIYNMIHLGARAFDEIAGEVVQTTSFVLKNSKIENYLATYFRLIGINGEREKKEATLNIKSGQLQNRLFYSNTNRFSKIPSMPTAYWVSDDFCNNYMDKKRIDDYAEVITGMTIGDNNKYLRLWYELSFNKISIGKEKMEEIDLNSSYWIPYSKGGQRRNWYGNNDYVVNWKMKDHFNRAKTTLQHLYLKEALTWPFVTPGLFSARFLPSGFLWDVAGSPCFFRKHEDALYALAFLCSCVADYTLKVVNPTINIQAIDVSRLPLIVDDNEYDIICSLAQECIELSKIDWDLFETSWDFKVHPLVEYSRGLWDVTAIEASLNKLYGKKYRSACSLEKCFLLWQGDCEERFNIIKSNEEKINELFINIYGLNKELSPFVEEKDVTVRRADLTRDIKSLVSYAVGCMFGRYSLYKNGIVYAGGDFDQSLYGEYQADTDAIIPITDEAYFKDDIVSRFEEFIKIVFGEESLEDNLEYIASALGSKGTNARDKIRAYFLNDFYKDHCNSFSVAGSGKRPIYWLFDSGKQNGFKALVYIHRYKTDTVGLIRSDYLSRIQSSIENALKNTEYIIQTTSSAVDKAQAVKRQDKYIKQLAEIKSYYPALTHIALQKIDINLDEGVKNNYTKFQGVEVIDENGKKQKIDLLAKI